MILTARETWGLIHGMILGALFLLFFAGGLAGLYLLRPEWVMLEGFREHLRRLNASIWLMAVVAWLTVLSGTYIVYPWYRATPAEGADLSLYPRAFLKANPQLSAWHYFGMEWKEHIAWFAPILATTAAYIVRRYGNQLATEEPLRRITLFIFALAFVVAGIAGLLGVLITKAAPIL
jgi:hypothetical protein